MILLILFGLWAIISGKVVLTKNIRFIGKKARIYGLLLIVLSFPCSFIASYLLQLMLPASLFANPYASIIINSIFIILFTFLLFAVLLAVPFREK